ncbi:O-antigen/teichoic acid export membrane protein [Thermohydrogenium kirishiense]|nr:O-antigen/teichoic acid export membrane protein [Thermohydrogenium kirishiense]
MRKKLSLNKVVKNFISLTLANIIGQFLVFIATIYIARYFGPEKFGIINFSNAIVMYFIVISNFGLQTLGTIELAKSNNNINKKVNNILSLRLILATFAYVFIIIFALLINKNSIYKLNILFYGLLVFPSAIYVDWIFNANEEMQYNSYSIIIKNFIYAIFVIVSIFIFKLKNIYYIAIFMFFASLISSLYLLIMVYKIYNLKFKFNLDFVDYKVLLKEGYPFFFSGIFATINSNIATIMLGFLRSDYEIGLYNSVYKIVNVFIMIAGLLFTPIYPVLIKYYNEKKYENLSNLINYLRKLIYIISVPLIFGSIILNKEIILILYGNKYNDASTTFIYLMIYVSILFIREVYGYSLNAWNLQKKYMKIVLISSIYNIISNFLFIRILGFEGAAINTLISELINLSLMFIQSNKAIKINYNNNFIYKILISCMLMTFSIYVFKYITHNGILLTIIGIIIYVLSLSITKTLTKDDLKTMTIKNS